MHHAIYPRPDAINKMRIKVNYRRSKSKVSHSLLHPHLAARLPGSPEPEISTSGWYVSPGLSSPRRGNSNVVLTVGASSTVNRRFIARAMITRSAKRDKPIEAPELIVFIAPSRERERISTPMQKVRAHQIYRGGGGGVSYRGGKRRIARLYTERKRHCKNAEFWDSFHGFEQ